MDKLQPQNVCSECDRTYKRYQDLRKHVTKKHPDKKDIIAPSRAVRVALNKNYAFKCPVCNKNFSYERNFNAHMKTHSILNGTEDSHLTKRNTLRQKCALCDFVTRYKKVCDKHYEETHGISIQSSTLQFATAYEFISWKVNLEKTSNCKFVKETHGTFLAGITTYICDRSGFHVAESASNKVNVYCPASIKQISLSDGKCSVIFVKTHVGHEKEIGHRLEDRQLLVSKLVRKIPLDDILSEKREAVSSAPLQRLHLLTKKELYNIEASFNLQPIARRYRNDAVSIDTWIKKAKDHCVILYKPQNSIMAEYCELRSEDFLLIVMNELQLNIIKHYSNDCICLSGTYGLKSCQYELHTLSVLDDSRQSFPCAFCISNRSDETVMRIFFECIKKKVGLVQANVFMSDMSEMYYNAWLKVMPGAKFRLYFTWHIDRVWRNNLKLITNKEKQIVVYKSLRTLHQETDQTTFELMLQNFYETYIQDPDTFEFCTYFNNNFIKNKKTWANCYRPQYSINTDMHIERLYKTIKYVYMRDKHAKRLDKAVYALMSFIRDKLFDRLVVVNEEVLPSKMKELQKRHKLSLRLDPNLISRIDDFWQFPSYTSIKKIYTIYENNAQCKCKLVCTDCETCIHRYSCSCLDSSIRWNMCKHIHLLCTYRKLQSLQISSGTERETDNLEDVCGVRVIKSEVTLEEVAEPAPSKRMKTLEDQKQEMIENFSNIIEGISSLAEFEALDQLAKSMRPNLAIRESEK